jgi:membrane protein involved in colicin uptake
MAALAAIAAAEAAGRPPTEAEEKAAQAAIAKSAASKAAWMRKKAAMAAMEEGLSPPLRGEEEGWVDGNGSGSGATKKVKKNSGASKVGLFFDATAFDRKNN